MRNQIIILVIVTLCACKQEPSLSTVESSTKKFAAISLLGDTLHAPPPSAALVSKYDQHKSKYLQDTNNIDNLIWLGRFEAYQGEYAKAIQLYTDGIDKAPTDYRLYRHRGHRYISIRKFDEAIADLEKASELIAGTENKAEPDGMPNAQNIPVSTDHGNIWYHLGLAYYLIDDLPNALKGFKNCLDIGSNDDNMVSATHWIYMILRRMDKPEEAKKYLIPITKEMNIIENQAYHKICLFYKGDLPMDALFEDGEASPSNDAMAYAVANWHLYNGDLLEAKPAFDKLLNKDSWSSFGFIAAEADFERNF